MCRQLHFAAPEPARAPRRSAALAVGLRAPRAARAAAPEKQLPRRFYGSFASEASRPSAVGPVRHRAPAQRAASIAHGRRGGHGGPGDRGGHARGGGRQGGHAGACALLQGARVGIALDLARPAPAPPRALTRARAQGWWYEAIVGSACPAPTLSQPRRCGALRATMQRRGGSKQASLLPLTAFPSCACADYDYKFLCIPKWPYPICCGGKARKKALKPRTWLPRTFSRRSPAATARALRAARLLKAPGATARRAFCGGSRAPHLVRRPDRIWSACAAPAARGAAPALPVLRCPAALPACLRCAPHAAACR